MKSNQLKLIFISCILIITSVFFYSVKAVDAEDTNNSVNYTESSNSTSSTTNTSSNTSTLNNTSSNTSNSATNTSTSDDETDNTTSFANYTGVSDTSSTTVSNYSPDSELGISQILNILLIVVGVLLIFLAIAIIIKINQ